MTASWTRLQNKDPERWYIWAYKGATDQNHEFFLDVGYEYETAREGGVKAFGKSEPGSVIERRGHVLMSCPMELKRQHDELGYDGISGQSRFDEIDARILKNRGAKDHFRGQRGQLYMTSVDETGGAELE